jgi:hypothetical protein
MSTMGVQSPSTLATHATPVVSKGGPLNYIKIRHGPYMGEERKVILHIATSKDGFIATLDDGFDWLPGPEGDEDYGLG